MSEGASAYELNAVPVTLSMSEYLDIIYRETGHRLYPEDVRAYYACNYCAGAAIADMRDKGKLLPLDMTTARAELDRAAQAYRDARDALDRAAAAVIRSGVVETSRTLRRREVTLCAAMGSTTLHVENTVTHNGKRIGHDYQFKGYEPLEIGGYKLPTPEWLEALWKVEDEFDIRYALGGPINVTAKAGQITSDKTDW